MEGLLRKLVTFPPTGLILDFEDAVAPWARMMPRERVCAAGVDRDYEGRAVPIRINAAGTSWHEQDLRAAVAAGPDAVVLPRPARQATCLRSSDN